MSDVLSNDAVAQALADLPGWAGNSLALQRSVEFSDFRSAIHAVTEVANVAEALDHHPDIDIRWRTVTFSVSTHSAGGVTSRDIDLARRISQIVERTA